jgi:hypothetical protein
MLKYQDVFVPGGFPRHTYNPRLSIGLEERISEAKDNLCKLVAVTGHTKSGKTVLVRKVLPPETSIWIDGGTASSEEEFWQLVLAQLNLFQTEEEEDSTGSSSALEAKGSAGADFLVVKGSGEVGATREASQSRLIRRGRSVSARVAALAGLKKLKIPLVIDDFHYLSPEIQGSLVRTLKPLIFDGAPVVIIAIPHRRYDAIKVEREMAGRISGIGVPPWSNSELAYIPVTGFKLLGREAQDLQVQRLASQAIGSPHLMQDFCRGISRLLSITASSTTVPLRFDDAQADTVFRDVADTIGRPIFEKLARGPRQRSDRIARQLKDGREVDIYELVLNALAHLKPGLISLEYEDLRAAIREVSSSQLPQLHEV